MFKVGDKVRYSEEETQYFVVALNGAEAWLKLGDDSFIAGLDCLTLVPEPKHLRWSVPKPMTIDWKHNNLVPTRNRKR